MQTATIIITSILCIVGGSVLGFLGAMLFVYFEKKKIKKNAEMFLDGKRENKIYLDDGRKLDVNRFTTFDEKGNKIIIELKGGIKIENAIQKSSESRRDNDEGRVQEKPSGTSGKDSRSTGKTSRRIRGILARLTRRRN